MAKMNVNLLGFKLQLAGLSVLAVLCVSMLVLGVWALFMYLGFLLAKWAVFTLFAYTITGWQYVAAVILLWMVSAPFRRSN